MAAKLTFILFSVAVLSLTTTGVCSAASQRSRIIHTKAPCKRIVVYYHDIIYNGNNSQNATSAIVGEPDWGNKTALARPMRYGDVVAFDGPLTSDHHLRSPPVARAQGFYVYDGKSMYAAWHGFSIVFNSTKHRGILTLAGQNLLVNETRDIPVVGGSGDFFMSRGIATFKTDDVEQEAYFRLKIEIKLYECWRLVA